MPNELILQVASSLRFKDLNSLLRTTHFLVDLLSPVLLSRALSTNTVVGSNKRSVLHWASAHNRVSLMTILLERGARASINTKDALRMTPLHSATVLGYETAVKLLLENGAETEIWNQPWMTPLLSAAVSGNYIVAKMLLEGGADIDSMGCMHNDKNPLHYAAALGHKDIVRLLVEKGCNTEAIDGIGLNAVQGAAAHGQEEMVKWLLALGGFGANIPFSSLDRVRSLSKISIASHGLDTSISSECDFCGFCLARKFPHLYRLSS